jgi:hypothetical protein
MMERNESSGKIIAEKRFDCNQNPKMTHNIAILKRINIW